MTPDEFVDAVKLATADEKADPVAVLDVIKKAMATMDVPPEEPPVDPLARVDSLLIDAKNLHTAGMAAKRQGNAKWRDLLTQARQARLDADTADPKHEAFQWEIEKQVGKGVRAETYHEDMLAFYAQQLDPALVSR